MHKFLKSILPRQLSYLSVADKFRRNAVFLWYSNRWLSNANSLKSHFKPATLAILVQGVALLLVLAAGFGWQILNARYFNSVLSPTFFHLVVAQSIFAMLLSIITGMDKWWRWIHAGFPLAAWVMGQWHVPQEIYLAAFLISLSLYWTTFRTQVPFYPSRRLAWQHVVQLLPPDRPVNLIDIGSGIGDMVMHVAQHGRAISKKSSFTGIEIAILPWLISYVRGYFKRSTAVFRLGNYNELDFAQYDIVFAYLSPAAMVGLWGKARREMRPGSLLISYEFEIPGVEADVFIPGIDGLPSLFAWKIEHDSN